MARPQRMLASKTFIHGDGTHIVFARNNSRAHGRMHDLAKWFVDGKRVPLRDALEVRCTGDVWRQGRARVVARKAMALASNEFRMLLRAEEMAAVTPREPVLLQAMNGSEGYVSSSMVPGRPLSLLPLEEMSAAKVRAIVSGALRALGRLHYGDGQCGIVHGDMTISNLIITGPEKGGRDATVSFVDLAEAKVVRHGGDSGQFVGEMGNLVMWLSLCGRLGEFVEGALDGYLRANPLTDRATAIMTMEMNLGLAGPGGGRGSGCK